MKTSYWIAITGIALSATAAIAQSETPTRQPTIVSGQALTAQPGPASNFTGKVTVAPVIKSEAPGRTTVGLVRFDAGARTNWHTHPAGQSLYVTEGCGWVQIEHEPAQRFCQGDAAYIRAGQRHWHGATPAGAMSHLAITESINGKNVDWAEPVTTAQYNGPAS